MRAKAAPLRAVGAIKRHVKGHPFEDEDDDEYDYDTRGPYRSDQCNTTFPDWPDFIKANAS